jgi:hypothetical protein
MNSTTEKTSTQTPISHSDETNSPRLTFLRDRIAELKRRALESGSSSDLQVRLECYEKSLSDLINNQNTKQNHQKSDTDINAEAVPAGQYPDKGRTDAGQTPDTGRTTSGPSADTSPKLNPLEQQIVEELHASSPSPLDKLPPDTQEQLFDLISRHPLTTVHKIIGLPAPQGWNLSTSRQSLYRFRERFAEQKRRQHRRQQKTVANAVMEDLAGADEQFTDASERLFKLRLLETANDPASKTRDLRDLFTTLIRLRTLSQKTSKETDLAQMQSSKNKVENPAPSVTDN